jgi:hypothetical protein
MSSAEYRKRLRDLFVLMRDLGFQVTDRSGKKHKKFRIVAPNGSSFQWVVASTPFDHRAWLEATQTLKRWLVSSGYLEARCHLMISNSPAQEQSFNWLFLQIRDIEKFHSLHLGSCGGL